jgi:hypothetical protein
MLAYPLFGGNDDGFFADLIKQGQRTLIIAYFERVGREIKGLEHFCKYEVLSR